MAARMRVDRCMFTPLRSNVLCRVAKWSDKLRKVRGQHRHGNFALAFKTSPLARSRTGGGYRYELRFGFCSCSLAILRHVLCAMQKDGEGLILRKAQSPRLGRRLRARLLLL